MKKVGYFIVFFSFIMMSFSCASSKIKYNCNAKVDNQQMLNKALKGYSISIPSSWESRMVNNSNLENADTWKNYIADNCVLIHSPKNFSKTNPREYVSIISIGALSKINGKSIKNVDIIIEDLTKNINKTFKNPKIAIAEFTHKKYGLYKMIDYSSTISNTNYTHVNAVIYYKKKGYIIYYKADNKNYNSYRKDISKVLQSFKIDE